MSDRSNIYELLEEAHEASYPNDTVAQFLKAISYDIGPIDKLSDGEMVERLSGYLKHPFHRSVPGRDDL